jgi:hypothetical protein
MESLYTYLRGRHEELLGVVGRIDARAKPAWRTFLDCHVDRCWPYELTSKSSLPTSIPAYSSSTSAMILYSLALALGMLRKSPLAPGVLEASASDTLPADRTGYERALCDGVRRLIDHANGPGAPGDEVVTSKSFGGDDPFTLTWCSELLRAIASSTLPDLVALRSDGTFTTFVAKFYRRAQAKVRSALENPTVSCLAFPTPERNAIDHPFPLIRAWHLAQSLSRTEGAPGSPSAAAAAHAEESIGTFGTRVYDHFVSRVHQHLSFHAMPNAQFDAAELVFGLEGIVLCGPHPGTAEEELLQRVFQVIEERQEQNPYWRPLKPFVTTPQGFALLPLSVEIANSLLRVCALLSQAGEAKDRFSLHLPLFTRYTEWLESRVDRGKTAAGAAVPSRPFFGWHSEHVSVPGRVHTWETSQVLIYLLHFRSMLKKHIAEAALAAAHLKSIPQGKRSGAAANHWTSKFEGSEPLSDCPDASEYRIYRRIKDDFLTRRDAPGEKPPHFSALLYGPPGTGKTRIAKALAKALAWPLIVITPSDFVAQGVSEVEMRAKAIFDVLREQSQAVVLFDEIDRLILDRDSRLYREQGDMFQFMTPGMLTKLHELRDGKRLIFLIATNYADRIDPAAKRTGRIDAKLLVTPPDLPQRVRTLIEILNEKFALTMPDAVVRPAAEKCPLAIYGELEDLVLSAITPLPSSERKNDAVRDALQKKAAGLKPGLRLASYESRFRRGTKRTPHAEDAVFPAAQEPFEEFFALVYIMCQAKDPVPGGTVTDALRTTALSDDDREVVKRAAKRLLTDDEFDKLNSGNPNGISAMRTALNSYLQDEHILGLLERWRFGV